MTLMTLYGATAELMVLTAQDIDDIIWDHGRTEVNDSAGHCRKLMTWGMAELGVMTAQDIDDVIWCHGERRQSRGTDIAG